ncbi:BQ2448_664 [Microbotryum intermedium]|uniref:BQ2448_664 protein n=1 Tax=Microbotryum intermedium TaxID=269621 RepID=A0A238F957_9BASI|nr:BQ2448_664 [Microbotryum intermedium]
MGRVKNDKRSVARQEPIEQVVLPEEKKQESLAVTRPHVAPAAEQKAKAKRAMSSTALKRQAKAKIAGMERSQKLEKRKQSVEGKKERKNKVKQMWD